MKKTLAGLLALLIVLASLPVLSLSAGAVGVSIPAEAATVTVDGEEFAVIRTKAQFLAYASTANTQNAILANDIDLEGQAFTAKLYKLSDSILDGNGHCIHNFSVSSAGNISVFDFTGTCMVRNLVIGTPEKPVSVSTSGSGKSVGVILGYSNATQILENLTVYGNVSSTDSHTGGLVGRFKGAMTVKNCHFIGTVSTTEIEAGDLGTGGLIGRAHGGGAFTVSDCSFRGTVTTDSGSTFAGGIIGTNERSDASFENCTTYGEVTANHQGGGILGRNTTTGVTVKNCISVSDVTAAVVGGIIGSEEGNLALSNCAILGSVSGTTAGLLAGNYVNTATADKVYAFNGVELPMIGTGAGAVTNGLTVSDLESAAAAAKLLNDDAALGALSDFIESTDGKSVCVATPRLVGVQETEVAEGSFDVRFVGAIGNSLKYRSVGFRIVATDGDLSRACTTVYDSILVNGALEAVTAASVDATYLYALTVTGIPATGTVTFDITPYAIAPDGSTEYLGTAYLVTYTNGAFVSIVEK